MVDLLSTDDFSLEQIDWEQLLDDPNLVLDDSSFNNDDGSSGQLSDPCPDRQWTVDDIEQLLLNDDVDQVPNLDNGNGLSKDIVHDSPGESDGVRGEVVDVSDGGQKTSSPEVESNSNSNSKDTDDGEEDDPVSKKRKRQERNRDAAVRSRERKKLYVRDLEMKSRYFEGECRRLGTLLNCVIAENQALRLSLQSSKAFDASMTKQESAVLLLESLLLGSLLWFLGTMCLLVLPEPLRTQELVPVEKENRGSLAPRVAGRKMFEHGLETPFMLGKRCKASRSRMKTVLLLVLA